MGDTGGQVFILVGGIIALALGTAWAALCHGGLLGLLKGVLPLLLIMAGIIAIYYGVEELRYPPWQVPPPPLSQGPEPTDTLPSSRHE